ncbi:MAG: hypothetical protein JXR81_06975 [Candidatus Goldbacteria bacterium]|nr:hypothetical protein [Candidatus Goldiibacteriota bacterium]
MKKYIFIFFILLTTAAFNLYGATTDTQTGKMSINLEVADPGGTDTVTRMVTLQHIKASEIEPFIKARLSIYGAVQTNDAMNMLIITDKLNKVNDLEAVVKRLDDRKLKNFMRLETEIIQIKNLQARALVDLIRERLSDTAIVKVDSNLNTLLITDVKSKIEQARELIEKLDVPVKQVMIEVKIVEVSNDEDSKIGIDWRTLLESVSAGAETSIRNLSQIGQVKVENGSLPVTEAKYKMTDSYGPQNSIGVKMSMNGINSIIGILTKEGKVKVISSPRVVASNNKYAFVDTGSRYYHKSLNSQNQNGSSSGYPQDTDISFNSSSTNVSVNTNNGAYSNSNFSSNQNYNYNYISTGIYLRVLPSIVSDNVVTLDINARISDVISWAPDGFPIVSNNETNSVITIKDGESFILGGLKKESTAEIVDRIPLLGHIPVLDLIFASRKTVKISNDVVIFISPTILADPNKAADTAPEKEPAGAAQNINTAP